MLLADQTVIEKEGADGPGPRWRTLPGQVGDLAAYVCVSFVLIMLKK